ncbi:MAG: RagB/SusD family nutrient uptake outer membrane protein [Tannerellaceae bacterium]|nr:RagB/SusD family nutrient uptake outer membrane protein [Tannerellaceae bacterium]
MGGALTPTGNLIDSYPMADGRLIHENGSTYNPFDPYKDRDPRLSQSVIYPTSQIGTSTPNGVEWVYYDPEDAGTIPDQQYNAKEPSSTGYVWKKYVDWSEHAMVQITDCGVDIIILRYADVLLMHAEALLETKGVTAKNEIIEILNQLRDRCKGGRIHADNYNSEDELRFLVRNERRVELANEGLRYFDIIRWKIAEKSPAIDGYGLKGEVYGAFMRLDGIGRNDRTATIDGAPRRYVETRIFKPEKHYTFPIPQKDVDLTNESLKQNKNW